MGEKIERKPKAETVTDPRQPGQKVAERLSSPEEEECVELASEDSFPASDPPSYTPVTHTGKPTKDHRDHNADNKQQGGD